MAQTLTSRKRIRKQFGSIGEVAEMPNLIEVQIGKDLQFVRINGTVVGALVGLVIYTVGQLIG